MNPRHPPFSAAQLVGLLAALTVGSPQGTRCAQPPPRRPSPWKDDVERALRCEGRADTASRITCFSQIVSAFNQWPHDDERRETFALVERHLKSWPSEQRFTRAPMVIFQREGRVLDTLRLVRALEDWYPEDSALDTGRNTQLTIGSPLADTVESYKLVRARVSYRWFSEGPGLSRLRSLELKDCNDYARNFALLLRWSSLKTLERIALDEEHDLVRSDSFWVVAREAPRLRELSFTGYGADHAAITLERERDLSQRLESLSILRAYLRTHEIKSLVQNRALTGLRRLDLRGNTLLESDVRALRDAPQFARTEILTDAPRS